MGKNKLKKFAEVHNFPNVIEFNFSFKQIKEHPFKGKWKQLFFKNQNPITLELACGKGEYTVALAQKYPNKNFIGIDIKGARIWTGAKKALELNLKNAGFIRTRIEFLPYFLAEDEIDEIWITFPDPQPKKPKKRLTSPYFLNLYKNFTKEKAPIHLKTDNQYLFEYTLKVLEKNNIKPIIACKDIYKEQNNIPKEAIEIQTYYEKQFLAENKKITYLQFRFSKKIIWQDIPKNPQGSPYK